MKKLESSDALKNFVEKNMDVLEINHNVLFCNACNKELK
jgi:hypothetical protein